MNPAGLAMGLLGTLVLCQVFGGRALQRLNIIGDAGKSDSVGKSIGSGIGGAIGDGVQQLVP